MKRPYGCGCLTKIAAFLVVALILYALHPWIFRELGYSVLCSDSLQKADVIVVMAGSYIIRTQEAAALYHEGWSPRVLLTRESPPDSFYQLKAKGILLPEMIDINQQVLEGLGVPRSSISRIEIPVDNTDEEARRIKEFLERDHLRRLIIVTSKTHSRRACMTFYHYLGKDLQIICRYSRFDPFDPTGWWKKRKDARELIFEWQKLILYRIQFLLSSIRNGGRKI
ncbi:MAG: YdcF family protein [Acidobacteria bacterium]|nr:YdcF family protein [Acidobacteriota bacterium]